MNESEVVGDVSGIWRYEEVSSVTTSPSTGGGGAAATITTDGRLVSHLGGLAPAMHHSSKSMPITVTIAHWKLWEIPSVRVFDGVFHRLLKRKSLTGTDGILKA